MSDQQMAHYARRVAQALIDAAMSRSDEDRRTLATLQSELCRLYREELTASQQPEAQSMQDDT